MIHDIITSPAAQVISLGKVSTLGTGLIAMALIIGYHRWLREHFGRHTHLSDLLAVVVAIAAGVSFAASWPGQLSHLLFAKVAEEWNSNGGVHGEDWATVIAILAVCAILGAILKISKRQHRGPLTPVLVLVIMLPLVLVATQGGFGERAMQAVALISRPINFQSW